MLPCGAASRQESATHACSTAAGIPLAEHAFYQGSLAKHTDRYTADVAVTFAGMHSQQKALCGGLNVVSLTCVPYLRKPCSLISLRS